jgi:hypothetical protein
MNEFDKTIHDLKKLGVKIAHGLTTEELDKVETFYSIKFHPDHRKLIQTGLFVGNKGCDWRNFSEKNIAKIRKMLNWPLEGILFDIEHGNYWDAKLGQKPTDSALAKKIFITWYKQNVPQLIPIYSHRYMSSKPKKIGAPVYSVYQTDIIYYGQNIFKYLTKEFKYSTEIEYPEWKKDDTPFWSEIVS